MAKKAIVLDTSVIVDIYAAPTHTRWKRALAIILECVNNSIIVYIPYLGLVEAASVLSRRIPASDVEKALAELTSLAVVVSEEEFRKEALRLALATHARATDIYFVAAARKKDAILLSNDKHQVRVAKTVGVESYYLLEEYVEAMSALKR